MSTDIFGHKIIRVLFLVYFLVYAATPLTYELGGGKGAPWGKGTSVDYSHLFWVEALASGVTDNDRWGDTGSSGKILLIKKRAVFNEDNISNKLNHSKDHVSIPEAAAMAEAGPVALISAPVCDESTALGGISFSGLSPPFRLRRNYFSTRSALPIFGNHIFLSSSISSVLILVAAFFYSPLMCGSKRSTIHNWTPGLSP